MFENVLPILGAALCVIAVMQMGLWSAQSLMQISRSKKEFELNCATMRERIEALTVEKNSPEQTLIAESDDASWKGFRPFRVASLVPETNLCTSVYLQPADGKPVPEFKPGQHLTFKFDIPGESKPVVRCYSLSDGPGKDYYRISVKKMLAPRDTPELPTGRASTFVNEGLKEGDTILVKSPAGSFFLDETSEKPVVFLAGGIGITPMMSMMDRVIATGVGRAAILIYGSRHGEDHAFKDKLKSLSTNNSNVHVINVYSSPLEKDVQGQDYDTSGFVSIDLIQKLLPHTEFQFYMCGPPPFMDSVYNGLVDWGVQESEIFFEAFGPASVGRKKKDAATQSGPSTTVNFKVSGTSATWDGAHDNLLELAEANDVMIDSGCRAGSCGTCQTAILKGKVKYPDGEADCDPGHCLVCIAKPDGELELEA